MSHSRDIALTCFLEEGGDSLSDLCLAQVCHSLGSMCEQRPDGSLRLRSSLALPRELADRLLRRMAAEGLLDDSTVGIFRDYKEHCLSRAVIRRCPLTAGAFSLAICPHRLQEVDVSWARGGGLTGAQVLSGLASNQACRSSLRSLSLRGLRLDWASLGGEGSPLGFSSLEGLRTLDLADTDLSTLALRDVCRLPLLESLDVSSSGVTDLAALALRGDTLESLGAHGLARLSMDPARLVSVLSRLRALRHLDVSEDPLGGGEGDLAGWQLREAVRLLLGGMMPRVLPALASLDLSGRKDITEEAVEGLVSARNGLVFLGLLATGLSSCEALSTRRNLTVTGEANQSQICEALRRYCGRECLAQEAIFQLYNNIADVVEPRPDIVQLVLSAMESHPGSLRLQTGATACLCTLTYGDLMKEMPVCLLRATVHRALHAMRTFPVPQVHKNGLIILFSEHIIQNIPFDKYSTAVFLINLLNSYRDPILQNIAVVVIGALVSELSTQRQAAKLGSDSSVIKGLLALVRQKARFGVLRDETLQHATMILWQLTSQPAAAHNFIQGQGLQLYKVVLKSYSQPLIQENLLGLLTVISAFEEFQENLMDEDLLAHTVAVLRDSEMEVRVRSMAGEILAQLTSRPEAWTLDKEFHVAIVDELHVCVKTWTEPEPDRDAIFHQSFHPFLNLLQTSQTSGVQLWAVWAIGVECSDNPTHCRGMLQVEGVVDLIKALVSHTDTHSDVRRLAEILMCRLEPHLSHPEPTGAPQSS